MKKIYPLIFWLFTIMFMVSCKSTPKDYLHESENDKQERMAWWEEAKFGMFIHWGLYSVLEGEYKGERPQYACLIMDQCHIPISEYEKLAYQFNPVQFDAYKWVSLAKQAGMKYIVITAKHHDGFCMYNSQFTDYDIVDATPFKRDPLKELAGACQKEGLKFCVYYSISDWHHPDEEAIHEPYYRQNKSGKTNPNFSRYYEDYMKPQLKELLTNYGDIGVMWFDGEWIPDYTSEMGKDIYNYLRNIKPDLIINNRVDVGRQGMMGLNKDGDFAGDFGTPEQQIPDTGMPGLFWESCKTMNDRWSYAHFDNNWKSPQDLINNLIDIVSKGGNFLLDVGPTPEGLFPGPSIDRLKIIGQWMALNGESIYGAEASPYESPTWGRFTRKDNHIYAHVFEWPEDGLLSIPEISNLRSAWILSDKRKSKLTVINSGNGITIQLPSGISHKYATVIVIEVDGKKS